MAMSTLAVAPRTSAGTAEEFLPYAQSNGIWLTAADTRTPYRAQSYSVRREDPMKTSLCTVGSLLILLLAVAVGVAKEDGRKKTCQDELNNNVYHCKVKAEDGDQFEACFRFISPGVFSQNFDLRIDPDALDLACECKAEGSFRRPKFEKSDEFHCVTVSGSEFNLAVEGEVEDHGDEIEDGQAVNNSGASFVMTCKRDSKCAVETTPTARSAGSRWGRK
jgi:hypothetical protein